MTTHSVPCSGLLPPPLLRGVISLVIMVQILSLARDLATSSS